MAWGYFALAFCGGLQSNQVRRSVDRYQDFRLDLVADIYVRRYDYFVVCPRTNQSLGPRVRYEGEG